MLRTRRLLFLALIQFLIPWGASAGEAGSYPNRPIRIIVPSAPGGATDVIARRMGDQLSRSLRQPVVVDNRAGALGIIAAELAARAKPDGYTLVLGNSSTLCINPALHKTLPFDSVKDFAPHYHGDPGQSHPSRQLEDPAADHLGVHRIR